MLHGTHFDQRNCHKWALLLAFRKQKLETLISRLGDENASEKKKLFQEIFYGTSMGKDADPGMAGSLLYHMAMVTKMETETSVLLSELDVAEPNITQQLNKFYADFISDSDELSEQSESNVTARVSTSHSLTSTEKIALFINLDKKTRALANRIELGDENLETYLRTLFKEWSNRVIEMRLRQEYHTIKGLLVLSSLSKSIGISKLDDAMQKVQDKFGRETVNIALDVTLKVGMRREKLQSIMLSDHYINYAMSIETLDGRMQFLNCPIYGSHKYISGKLGIAEEIASLFCTHFCFAHAKAMLETVLPFTFDLTQPKRLSIDDKCEYYMRLGASPTTKTSEKYVPLVVSWNLTRKCNLKCSHCYINATTKELDGELTTEESKNLIDQISEVSRPLLILSGGEPLLRKDVYELIQYGTKKGLRMGLGSNGGLIDIKAARALKEAGIKTVSISIDSNIPQQHDEFRGVAGSWNKAIGAIKALVENGVLVQVNTTLTQQNYGQIDDIMTLVEDIGVENFHLFFLVPTGRGAKMADISPAMYESMIKNTFAKTIKHKLNVRPSCAPQFMRIAKAMDLDMKQWIRGCIAGMYYCRIYPNGDVTPCPYLPVRLGNIRETSFKNIWFNSPIFKNLRNPACLKGKCSECSYKTVCGGCRARAYGLSSEFIDFCGDLHEPTELKADYLAEDPWCVYDPKPSKSPN
ncbi:MAG TPA: radical SAM protein [Candidatus Nanoarchaeia archaeon]|nr:radical SAM protein [Candidatus Nanoarchaeia archaeon]